SWTLDSLSERLGYSPRQVERRFKEGVGLSPMALWRVLRFQRFLRLSAASPGASLTDLALGGGYSDQSHLIRDFKAIAGSPPSTFFREPHEMSDQITLSR